MTAKTLEERLGGVGNVADFLRNQQVGPNVYPGVPSEYSNWRDEQRAWQETCVLYNQSYHMADLWVEGPDAIKLLSYLGVNSFKGFAVGKAKQFVPCSYDGYVIGDVILFYMGENQFNLVGRAPTLNWVRYHAETGGYDVTVEMDERTAKRTDGRRKSYRFQIQGPNAMKVMEKVLGETPPDLKFFNMTMVTIAGRQVHALRHGMAGQPGFELFGPWDDGEAVRMALFEAGQEYGLRLVGGRAYSSNTLESGWIPSPLPAIYTGDERMKAYREWLPADSYEGTCSLGGSLHSDNIEDYYLTPGDLGYGFFVKFDHDFIGREALEKMAAAPKRHKVTLALDSEDVMRVMSSMFHKGDRAKAIEFPSAVYAMHPFDKVLVDGKSVGVSTWVGYSANEGKMLTLAIVDEAYAKPGTKITLLWGEENGGSKKPTVERHVQTEISGVVAAVPYAEVARDAYADSWRNRAA
jgi:syringate O-demethylase